MAVKAAGVLVPLLGVLAEDAGDGDRQRAVDIDGKLGDLLGVDEFVEKQHELLRALDGEGGNDDVSAARGDALHDAGELLLHVADGCVQAVAIGALHDEVVGGGRGVGIADDGQVLAANVAGKEQARLLALLHGVDQHVG